MYGTAKSIESSVIFCFLYVYFFLEQHLDALFSTALGAPIMIGLDL